MLLCNAREARASTNPPTHTALAPFAAVNALLVQLDESGLHGGDVRVLQCEAKRRARQGRTAAAAARGGSSGDSVCLLVLASPIVGTSLAFHTPRQHTPHLTLECPKLGKQSREAVWRVRELKKVLC